MYGAVPAGVPALVADEVGRGKFRTTRIKMTELEVTMADDAGVVAYGGRLVYTFPEGVVNILGAHARLDRVERTVGTVSTGIFNAFDGDAAVGTATATTGATLTGTEADIVPSFATAQASAGVSAGGQGVAIAAVGVKDGSAGAIALYMNVIVDDADHDVTGLASNLKVSGEIEIQWVDNGDK